MAEEKENAVPNDVKDEDTQEKKQDHKIEEHEKVTVESAQRKAKIALSCFIVSIPFALFLLFSALLSFLPRLAEIFPEMPMDKAEAFMPLATTMTIVSAVIMMVLHFPIYRHGIINLKRGFPNTNSLIALSTLASFIYGTSSLMLTDSDIVKGMPTSWFAPFALTLLFTGLGRYIEARAHIVSLTERRNAHALGDDEPPFVAPNEPTISGYGAVFAMTISVIVGAIWFAVSGVSDAASIFLAVLIACCPVAISLVESPILLMAIEKARDLGIVIRNQDTVNDLANIDVIVLGKGDILTEGKPQITDAVPEGITMNTFMGLAAAAESGSHHPYAAAITERAIRIHAREPRVAAFTEIPSIGVEIMSNGRPIRIGQSEWVKAQRVYISADLLTRADQLMEKGKSVVFVSNGYDAKGIIAFENIIREDAKETIAALKEMNIEPVLITGDATRTAKAIAKKLGITNVLSELHGDDVAEAIEKLKQDGKKTVALYDKLKSKTLSKSVADIVIAPTSAEENDRYDAPVVMTSTELSTLPKLIKIATNATNAVRKNFIWAFGGALFAVLAAVGILYVFGGPLLAPSMVIASSLPGFIASMINIVRYKRS